MEIDFTEDVLRFNVFIKSKLQVLEICFYLYLGANHIYHLYIITFLLH